jgi:hypothetical protein
MDLSYQVMIYDSTQKAYQNLMDSLPDLFRSFGATDEYLSEELLDEMEKQCRDSFFCGEMIPPYAPEDIVRILKYYAQYEAAPHFYTFDQEINWTWHRLPSIFGTRIWENVNGLNI